MPAEEEDKAIELGDGSIPEGVRVAMRQMLVLGRPLRLDAYGSEALRRAKPGDHLAPLIEAAVRGEFAKFRGPSGLLTKELGVDLMKFAERLGEGDPVEGLRRALTAAHTMGVSAVKRLNGNSD